MERYSIKQGELFKKGDTFDLESLLTTTMRQAKSRRDVPTTPRYAMSGFHIRMGVFIRVI